jgi:hypothetical protein
MDAIQQRSTSTELRIPGSYYSNEQRREAVLLYVIHGCAARVARDTRIPETTLSGWRKQPWWVALLEEVRTEKEDELDAKMSETIDLAMGELRDRIVNCMRRQPTSITGSSHIEELADQLTAWHRSEKAKLVGQGSTEDKS